MIAIWVTGLISVRDFSCPGPGFTTCKTLIPLLMPAWGNSCGMLDRAGHPYFHL
jgi:hypothetical protein